MGMGGGQAGIQHRQGTLCERLKVTQLAWRPHPPFILAGSDSQETCPFLGGLSWLWGHTTWGARAETPIMMSPLRRCQNGIHMRQNVAPSRPRECVADRVFILGFALQRWLLWLLSILVFCGLNQTPLELNLFFSTCYLLVSQRQEWPHSWVSLKLPRHISCQKRD